MKALRKALSVVALAAVAGGCGDLLVPGSPRNLNVEDFEAAWSFIDSIYPMFDEKGIDWDSVYTVFRPRADVSRGDEGQQILHDLVESIRDGHAYYQTKGGGGGYCPSLTLRHTIAMPKKYAIPVITRISILWCSAWGNMKKWNTAAIAVPVALKNARNLPTYCSGTTSLIR